MKKLFFLCLIICAVSQTCFAWSLSGFFWPRKSPIAADKSDQKIEKLDKDVHGVKKMIGELDTRVYAIDSKATDNTAEIVKIWQDTTKTNQKIDGFDQRITALNQQISALPTADVMESSDVVPLTIGGKYIGTVNYEFENMDLCGPDPYYNNPKKISCVTVNINGFKAVKIRTDGTLNPMNQRVFFDQPNCGGDIYIIASIAEGSKMGLPLLEGAISDVNGELYYYSKNSQVMQITYDHYKSFISYSPDEYYNQENIQYHMHNAQYAGNGRCWNYTWTSPTSNASDYIVYVYKLLPNDPAITGIDEYPFKGEILVNGRPIIDLSQVPMASME